MPWKLPVVQGKFICPNCQNRSLIIGAAFRAVIEDNEIICKAIVGINEGVFCESCERSFEIPEGIRKRVKEFRGG